MTYNSGYGYVIAGFDPHVQRSLAAVLFAGPDEQLYLFPRSLLTPTKEDRKKLSKSQLVKRQELPYVGGHYRFTAQSNIITTFQKCPKQDTIKQGRDCALYKGKCVISPSAKHLCWEETFGIIDSVPKNKMDYVVPDIPLTLWLRLEVDFGGINPRIEEITTLGGLNPVLKYSFEKFGGVVINEKDLELDDYFREAPWNRYHPVMGIRMGDLYAQPDEVEVYTVSKNRLTPHGLPHFLRSIGVVLEPNKIYCKARPDEPFYMPSLGLKYEHDYLYDIGVILHIYVLWEPVSRRYIVVDYDYSNAVLRIKYERDGTTLFRVNVKMVKRAYYRDNTLGLIIDSAGVLANENHSNRCNFNVWVKYDGPQPKCAFSIVKKVVVPEESVENVQMMSDWRDEDGRVPEKVMKKFACLECFDH